MMWQPIETAPKDGTYVLLYVEIAETPIVRNGAWVKADDWGDPEPDEVDGWWCYSNSVSQELLVGIFEPTHWMPMPEPPHE